MKKLLLLSITILLLSIQSFAQQDSSKISTEELQAKIDELKGTLDGLSESYLETKSTVDALKKIKLSGYIQSQFQSAQNDGVASYAGGNFSSGIHNRILVRRGRLKVAYDADVTQYVLQIDATEKGVGLKDAYVLARDPWLRTFALKAGVFDRPFGFEISYSSSMRESPERSRLFQTLFPGERDLGASLEIAPPEEMGFLSHFNFKGGMFVGNGIAVETDNQKDFIGRLGFTLPFYEENLAIDGGVSMYMGKVKKALDKKFYTVDSPTKATLSADSSIAAWADRNYIGADLQIYYSLPVFGGFTLRGEFISGKQPGAKSASGSPTAAITSDLYLRNFLGYYFMYVQNLGETNQLVVKYDVYDPNKDVAGDEIGQNSSAKLTAGDLKYSTFALGLVHYWSENVKFVLYYDMVQNEKSANLSGYKEDLKDNVVTFRVQYKF